MVQGRGDADNSIMDMLRQITKRLEGIEIVQKRGVHLDDVSDDEEVVPNPNPEPEIKQDEDRLPKVFSRENSRPTIEVSFYNGRLETNVVLDWISEIDKFFEYESTPKNKMVKIVVIKLKRHASLWWDHFQTERHKRGKENIKTWEKMIGKMKKKLLPIDYQVNLLRRM